jgi:hypothetical protein
MIRWHQKKIKTKNIFPTFGLATEDIEKRKIWIRKCAQMDLEPSVKCKSIWTQILHYNF